jgi:hypothetical protein
MNSVPQAADSSSAPPKPGMAPKWLVAILVLTFAFVLMPFLLWYMTTFTRPLSDADLAAYFQDTMHPRRAQHALSQIADRIMSPNPGIRQSAKIWYPEVIKFSEQGSDELRVTAAWVMGQDNQSPEFHAALLRQLADVNPMVQRNSALSLVRFADPSGHALIAAMLTPYTEAAQRTGILSIRLKPGDVINPGTLLAHITIGNDKTEVRTNVPGTRAIIARRSQPRNGVGIPARPIFDWPEGRFARCHSIRSRRRRNAASDSAAGRAHRARNLRAAVTGD